MDEVVDLMGWDEVRRIGVRKNKKVSGIVRVGDVCLCEERNEGGGRGLWDIWEGDNREEGFFD